MGWLYTFTTGLALQCVVHYLGRGLVHEWIFNLKKDFQVPSISGKSFLPREQFRARR
jgi:hypothetical protein